MLPHLKPVKWIDTTIKVLAVVIPLMYMLMYFIDFKDDECDANLDPNGYGKCFNPKKI